MSERTRKLGEWQDECSRKKRLPKKRIFNWNEGITRKAGE